MADAIDRVAGELLGGTPVTPTPVPDRLDLVADHLESGQPPQFPRQIGGAYGDVLNYFDLNAMPRAPGDETFGSAALNEAARSLTGEGGLPQSAGEGVQEALRQAFPGTMSTLDLAHRIQELREGKKPSEAFPFLDYGPAEWGRVAGGAGLQSLLLASGIRAMLKGRGAPARPVIPEVPPPPPPPAGMTGVIPNADLKYAGAAPTNVPVGDINYAGPLLSRREIPGAGPNAPQPQYHPGQIIPHPPVSPVELPQDLPPTPTGNVMLDAAEWAKGLQDQAQKLGVEARTVKAVTGTVPQVLADEIIRINAELRRGYQPNAISQPSTTGVPSSPQGAGVDAGTPLREQGAAAPVRPQVQGGPQPEAAAPQSGAGPVPQTITAPLGPQPPPVPPEFGGPEATAAYGAEQAPGVANRYLREAVARGELDPEAIVPGEGWSAEDARDWSRAVLAKNPQAALTAARRIEKNLMRPGDPALLHAYNDLLAHAHGVAREASMARPADPVLRNAADIAEKAHVEFLQGPLSKAKGMAQQQMVGFQGAYPPDFETFPGMMKEAMDMTDGQPVAPETKAKMYHRAKGYEALQKEEQAGLDKLQKEIDKKLPKRTTPNDAQMQKEMDDFIRRATAECK